MNILMLNGSPKVKSSNTEYLLSLLKSKLEDKLENQYIETYSINNMKEKDQILEKIKSSDILVIGIPLYVDSIPSHLLSFLEYAEGKLSKEQLKVKLYVVANCGFYEGVQNKILNNMLRLWSQKTGITWGQGVATGAGEMLGMLKDKMPSDVGPSKNLNTMLEKLSINIMNKNSDEDIFVSPSFFPSIAFRLFAGFFWVDKAKNNGLKKRDLYKKIL